MENSEYNSEDILPKLSKPCSICKSKHAIVP